jgi:hypothetical protein
MERGLIGIFELAGKISTISRLMWPTDKPLGSTQKNLDTRP